MTEQDKDHAPDKDKDKDKAKHEADKRAAEKHTADEKAAAEKAATDKRVELAKPPAEASQKPEQHEKHPDKDHDKDQHAGHAGHGGHVGHIDNRDQDPDDPANKTPAKKPDAMRPGAERDHIEGAVYSRENLMTEQEKDAGGDSLGVGPLARSESSPGPVTTMEDEGIGPRTPYPTGDPPPPSESTTYGQGIKGVTDKPKAKPGDSSGPAGKAPALGDKTKAYDADAAARHKPEPAKPEPHKDPMR